MEMKRKLLCALSVAGLLGSASQVHACYYHALLGMSEPKGVWPEDAKSAAQQLRTQDSAEDAAISNAIAAPLGAPLAGGPIVDTYLTSWLINTNGATGKSTNTTINNAVKTIPANIQLVRY